MRRFELWVTVFSIFIIGTGFIAFSFQMEVPEKVKQAFADKFPDSNPTAWERESANEWEAEFRIKGVPYSAVFTDQGIWTETEHEIKKKNIPPAIEKVLAASYPGYTLDEAELAETRDGIFYEIEMHRGLREKEVYFDKNGNIIKRKTEDPDGSDDED